MNSYDVSRSEVMHKQREFPFEAVPHLKHSTPPHLGSVTVKAPLVLKPREAMPQVDAFGKVNPPTAVYSFMRQHSCNNIMQQN